MEYIRLILDFSCDFTFSGQLSAKLINKIKIRRIVP